MSSLFSLFWHSNSFVIHPVISHQRPGRALSPSAEEENGSLRRVRQNTNGSLREQSVGADSDTDPSRCAQRTCPRIDSVPRLHSVFNPLRQPTPFAGACTPGRSRAAGCSPLGLGSPSRRWGPLPGARRFRSAVRGAARGGAALQPLPPRGQKSVCLHAPAPILRSQNFSDRARLLSPSGFEPHTLPSLLSPRPLSTVSGAVAIFDREPSYGGGHGGSRPPPRDPRSEYDFPDSAFKDWSWPVYSESDRAQDGRLFTLLGFAGENGEMGVDHFRDYLVRTEGMQTCARGHAGCLPALALRAHTQGSAVR